MDNKYNDKKATAAPQPAAEPFEYNTQLKRMVLPEYGRNVQSMVDHALTLTDRDERTRCAKTIISIMGNLFPHLRDTEDTKHKLWDHLAIMSDFKLDIDYPYEVISQENLHTKPDTVPYGTPGRVNSRLYGKYIEKMIDEACAMEPGIEQDELMRMIALQMKRCCMTLSRDGEVDDEKVLNDLYDLSRGRVDIAPGAIDLTIPKEQPAGKQQQTKKSKNVQRKAVR